MRVKIEQFEKDAINIFSCRIAQFHDAGRIRILSDSYVTAMVGHVLTYLLTNFGGKGFWIHGANINKDVQTIKCANRFEWRFRRIV